jgi:hypothetical protein
VAVGLVLTLFETLVVLSAKTVVFTLCTSVAKSMAGLS